MSAAKALEKAVNQVVEETLRERGNEIELLAVFTDFLGKGTALEEKQIKSHLHAMTGDTSKSYDPLPRRRGRL